MRDPGIRYSIVTNEDIENLANKWTCGESSFAVRGVSGHLEIRVITTEIPEGAGAIFRDVQRLRVTSRTDDDIGDLLFSDTFPGSTIELDTTSSSDLSTEFELLSYLELFTGMTLKESNGITKFIEAHGHKLLRSAETRFDQLHKYIMSQLTDVVSVNDLNVELAELLYDAETEQVVVRIVAAMPEQLRIDVTETYLPSEVGLLQRQKRQLQDSEFKGLSAFLPSHDLSESLPQVSSHYLS